MRINFLYKGVLVAAMLCVAPAALPASPKASPPSVRTTGSGQGAFANEASNLLLQIQADALRVRVRTDRLQAQAREPLVIGWRMYAGELLNVRDQVNAMDKLLSELRANQSQALPWQRKAIDRIVPSLMNLTDTTQDAIVALNNDQGHVYFANLAGLADHMYNEAKLIDQAIGGFEKYAKARHQAPQLKQTVGPKNNS
jgi:hypothetical protein